MNCDRHTAWPVPKSFPSQMTAPGSPGLSSNASFGRALPPLPLHIPVSPQHHSLPRILSPKGCRQAAGSWSMQDVTCGGLCQDTWPSGGSRERDVRRGTALGAASAFPLHLLTTRWLERGDRHFFLLGSSLEARGWGWRLPL